MIKHTEASWQLLHPEFEEGKVDNYFEISAGMGFFTPDNKEYKGVPSGFAARAYLHKGDAVLLANAKKMYDILVKFTSVKNERELDELTQTASAMLEEMEAQANEES